MNEISSIRAALKDSTDTLRDWRQSHQTMVSKAKTDLDIITKYFPFGKTFLSSQRIFQNVVSFPARFGAVDN
jgi:hypothetical protein